ncbi:hypothetical protein BX600DRAFT_499742 [Xylariales sp. PMI_506]|nr:hypothetical protein BX600DRAFT_499742 [Xylariales sp. PMI_506]
MNISGPLNLMVTSRPSPITWADTTPKLTTATTTKQMPTAVSEAIALADTKSHKTISPVRVAHQQSNGQWIIEDPSSAGELKSVPIYYKAEPVGGTRQLKGQSLNKSGHGSTYFDQHSEVHDGTVMSHYVVRQDEQVQDFGSDWRPSRTRSLLSWKQSQELPPQHNESQSLVRQDLTKGSSVDTELELLSLQQPRVSPQPRTSQIVLQEDLDFYIMILNGREPPHHAEVYRRQQGPQHHQPYVEKNGTQQQYRQSRYTQVMAQEDLDFYTMLIDGGGM